ncbi:MAG: aspartate aminotransferase family protein [Bacteroidales bacterium]|nr:aspartate aminotransferase family protein [Bacteroidales bacterium]
MDVLRQLFFQHVAQTSESPLALEFDKAEGIYLYDPSGKQYIDLISGISVSNIGHCHPDVVRAIQEQAAKYLHLMVYGEYILSPQVKLARLLADLLPEKLNSIYYLNSGSEAVEAALKLAKRVTGRSKIIACKNAYHGSTQGALSVMGNETMKQSFRPLIPGIQFIRFNEGEDLSVITDKTACVIIEPVQGEAGVRIPRTEYLNKLRKKCNETGTLLIFDEAQTGFGRTGFLFAFIKYNVVPDIMIVAKAMGGGLPLSGVIASMDLLRAFTNNPVLGHITTFGGHPLCCAASYAALKVLINENLISSVQEKANLFVQLLQHKRIKEIRNEGLMMACQLEDGQQVRKVIQNCIQKGLITDWFLFCDSALRIAPALTISNEEIIKSCKILLEAIDNL